jgi:O-antigen ligase
LGAIFFITPSAYWNYLYDNSDYPKNFIFYFLSCILFFYIAGWKRDISKNLINEKSDADSFGEKNLADKELKNSNHKISILFIMVVLLFLLWMLVTVFFAINPRLATGQFLEFAARISIFLFIFLYYQKFSLLKLSIWASWGITLVSLLGILQYFGMAPDIIKQLAAPAATFVNKNYAAHYLGLIFPFTLISFFLLKKTFHIILSGISVWAVLTYIVYTQTRGLWVALSGAFLYIIIVLYLFYKKRLKEKRKNIISGIISRFSLKKKVLSIVILMAIIMAFIPGKIHKKSFISRLQSISKPQGDSSKNRLAVWQNSLEIIKDHPIMGVGPRGFQLIYPAYNNRKIVTPEFTLDSQHREAHNDYLQFISEMGILGGLLFLIIILSNPIISIIVFRNQFITRRNIIILFLSSGLITLAIHALFEFPSLSIPSANLMWILFAFWLGEINKQISNGSKKSKYQIEVTGRNAIRGINIWKNISRETFYNNVYIITLKFIFILTMVLISFFQIIGGRQVINTITLQAILQSQKTSYKAQCSQIMQKIKKASFYLPFEQSVHRFKILFYAECSNPSLHSLSELENFLLEDPYFLKIWFQIIFYKIELNQLYEAETLLQKYRKLLPSDAHGMALKGILSQKQGKTIEAKEWIQKAVKLKPSIQAWIYMEYKK